MKRVFLLLVCLVCIPGYAIADLTGIWTCNDGGTYYVRQIGNEVLWYGENDARHPRWSNVFHGNLSSRGNTLIGTWADVPKGRTSGMGEMRIRIKADGNIMESYHQTGGFGGSIWTRRGYRPHASSAGSSQILPPPVRRIHPRHAREDCIPFDPDQLTLVSQNERWKIKEGRSHWLYDFGENRTEASKALSIIRYYRANQSCYVGRPGPSMHYILSSGHPPAGAMNGEDCIGFNPSNLRIEQIGGHWKIVEGRHWLKDFNGSKSEAQTALSIIRKYRFTHACYVGRPGPSFTYWRK